MDSNDPSASLYVRLGGREKIKDLLTKFYAMTGRDQVLAPVFNAAIHDWAHHIDHVTDFWSTQTGGPAVYPGGMGRHVRLDLGLEHFAAWLVLWEKNCRDELPPREADEMMVIARLFAERLKVMTGNVCPVSRLSHPRRG